MLYFKKWLNRAAVISLNAMLLIVIQTMHFWPFVGYSKMCFFRKENCKQTAELLAYKSWCKHSFNWRYPTDLFLLLFVTFISSSSKAAPFIFCSMNQFQIYFLEFPINSNPFALFSVSIVVLSNRTFLDQLIK